MSQNPLNKDKLAAVSIVRYNADMSKSQLMTYQAPVTPKLLTSLEHLDSSIKKEIIPLINSGIKSSQVAACLNVKPSAISKYCKDSMYKWSIEHRAYITLEEYDKYLRSKEYKIKKYTKTFKTTKQIKVEVSGRIFNIIEIMKCLKNLSTAQLIENVIETSATEEQKTLAKNYTFTVKSRVVKE